MAREFFLGYNDVSGQVYLNTHGEKDAEKAVFVGSELDELVKMLAERYDGKKIALKTDLPRGLRMEFEIRVNMKYALRKLSITN